MLPTQLTRCQSWTMDTGEISVTALIFGYILLCGAFTEFRRNYACISRKEIPVNPNAFCDSPTVSLLLAHLMCVPIFTRPLFRAPRLAAGVAVSNPPPNQGIIRRRATGRFPYLVSESPQIAVGKRRRLRTFRDTDRPLKIVNLEYRPLYDALGELNTHKNPPRPQAATNPTARTN